MSVLPENLPAIQNAKIPARDAIRKSLHFRRRRKGIFRLSRRFVASFDHGATIRGAFPEELETLVGNVDQILSKLAIFKTALKRAKEAA